MRLTITGIFVFFSLLSISQIITSDPPFPNPENGVTIFYDSSQGNAALANTTMVYMHTGVITSNSNSPTDWQHVVGNWGTADAQVLMTNEGGGIHSFTFSPSLNEWYNVNNGEIIERMAFVFRDASGNTVGRDEDGGDIFYDLSDGTFQVIFQEPSATSILAEISEEVSYSASSTAAADLTVTFDGNEVLTAEDSQTISGTVSADSQGEFDVIVTAELNGNTVADTFSIVVVPDVTIAAPPNGIENGINYIDDNTVVLMLHAPYKDNVFVLGDFNDWSPSTEYMMNLNPQQTHWWLEIDDLDPDTEYRFQYSVDFDQMRIADPYTEKVLDQWNDPWIPAETYPNLTPYPQFLTTEAVSTFQINQQEFEWTDNSYEMPAKERLNIYELLVRDFREERNFQAVLDSLDYLEKLGVNAVQFMPVNEFEGNMSWGYNPSFFFAVDKFYGGETAYKELINECHNRGIAVIMDIALNHSFGQNPQVRLYFDPEAGDFGQPTFQSPWFNEVPKHDFNVGYDYNHESPATKQFTRRVLQYWLNEYHIDGFRMDLSKGFTQNNTLGDIGAWNSYDQSRINILNDYKNAMLEANPDAYWILEHFANNDEETALANTGSMFWGNLNHEYNEATMGYNSNLSWGSYQQRGWNNPHLVTFMESHDEERLMYKNLLFGNSSGNYDITDLETALDRVELASVFLYGIPGPKMAWQFGELGYDYSINYCTDGTISEDCRTGEKPVRWDYYDEEGRKDLYDVTSILLYLRNNYDFMHTTNFNIDVAGMGKRIHLNGDINATIIGNFSVNEISMVPGFQQTGTWYEVFTGDEITENNLDNAFLLQPGEYRFYVDQEIELPDFNSINELAAQKTTFKVFPNPSNGELTVEIPDGFMNETISIRVISPIGQTLYEETINAHQKEKFLNLRTSQIENGLYQIVLENKNAALSTTLMIMK